MFKPGEKDFLDAFDKHSDGLYRHVFFRTGNQDLAEDITQETFIKTWKYIVAGQEIKNIKSFLYKVAINLIIDNSRKKQAVSLEKMEEAGAMIAEKEHMGPVRLNSMEERIFDRMDAKAVVKLLDELDDAHKQVIVMRYIDELMPAEIAEILEETANAVSVRLNQAIKRLRQIISQKQGYGK